LESDHDYRRVLGVAAGISSSKQKINPTLREGLGKDYVSFASIIFTREMRTIFSELPGIIS